ncbi:MAG: hypothetical protein JSS76_11450 [Bacteroidetes bacterium]|nr:hypothetical protein [Bacteroidota bacterium]
MEETNLEKDPAEERIGKYSSKKLLEIVEKQANAYSEDYLDLVKNELIRRGETFAYDRKLKEEVEALRDYELRDVVEKDYERYNLEYLELATEEYIKRGFKNNSRPISQAQTLTNKTAPIANKEPIEERPRIGFWGNLYIYGRLIAPVVFFLIVMWKGCGNTEDKDYETSKPASQSQTQAAQPENNSPSQPTYKYYPAGQFLSEGNKLYIDKGTEKIPYGMISNIEDIEGKTIISISTYDGRLIHLTQHEFSNVKLYVYSGDF